MNEGITDPSDWPAEYASLRDIDSHLRCPICKELLRAAMMLQCHHNFCSECIRRHLDKESSCPACRVQTSTAQMRRNVALDEIANCFKDCRSSLLKTVTDALKPKLKDNPQLSRAESMDIDDIAPQSKRRRTSSRISKKASSNSSSQELMDTSMGHHTLGDDDKDDDDKDDDFIISPLQRNSDASIINNTTIDGHSRSGSSPLHNRTKHMQISNSPVKQTYPEPKRIPKLTYSVLNDKQLRKKLQELGLPTHGDKQLMQKRHAEYVTIHNANCDATRPQTIAQLKKTMDVWERTYAQDLQAKDAQRRSLEEQQKRQQLELARRRAQEAQESATTSTHAAGTADASTGVDPAVDLMLNTVTLPSSQGSNHIDSGSGSGSTSSFVPNQANNNSVAVAVAEASAFAHALKYADEYAELMADVKRRQQADKEKQALADKKDPEKEQERERQDPQP
ncbi:hypothetical protein EDD21DRAFT_303197 [Dissophora ornata]|nr:hypothetical protein EDD21DRAFT_303197 [Dissophora ornata]